jgi:hypothetical protein
MYFFVDDHFAEVREAGRPLAVVPALSDLSLKTTVEHWHVEFPSLWPAAINYLTTICPSELPVKTNWSCSFENPTLFTG